MERKILFIVLFITLFLLLNPSNLGSGSENVTNEWPMYRHDPQHTGYVETLAPSEGNPIWAFEAGDVISSSPAVADGIVYFASHDGHLYAVDAKSGEEVWSESIGDWGGWEFPKTGSIGDRLLSSPAVGENRVFVGSWDNQVYAFQASTGEKLWTFQTGIYEKKTVSVLPKTLRSVYVFSGKVYGVYVLQGVFFGLGVLFSLFLFLKVDKALKKLFLSVIVVFCMVFAFLPFFQVQESEVVVPGGRVDSSPAIENGFVYVGSRDNKMYALDAETGEMEWSFETGDIVTSSPAVWNDYVFFGSRDDNIYSLDKKTGELNWVYETGGLVHSSPAVEDGVLYIGSKDGNVYAIDALTGEKIWNKKISVQEGRKFVLSSPAVWDEKVFVGSYNYNVYALNAENGDTIWKYKTNYRVGYPSPAVADGKVYIGSHDGSYYALDAETGDKLWSFNTVGGEEDLGYVITSPAVADNKVFAPAAVWEKDDSHLYALGSLIDIKVENLSVSPQKARVDGTITVRAEIKNLTSFEGKRTVILKVIVPGVIGQALAEDVITKQVVFSPNESKMVEFKFTIDRKDSYDVVLGQKSVNIDVLEKLY